MFERLKKTQVGKGLAAEGILNYFFRLINKVQDDLENNKVEKTF